MGVKSAKRLFIKNLGPGGGVDMDKFAKTLLAHQNNPDPKTGVRPGHLWPGAA